MSVTTLEPYGPALVSELPPAVAAPSLLQRLRSAAAARVQERSFERALRHASPGEHSDLLAAARRG